MFRISLNTVLNFPSSSKKKKKIGQIFKNFKHILSKLNNLNNFKKQTGVFPKISVAFKVEKRPSFASRLITMQLMSL